MQKEPYLFIIWQNASFMEKQIVTDIKNNFEIFRVYEICWTPAYFANNLSRFYGKKLPKSCRKEREVGTGAFKLYIVYDALPQYVNGVNINIIKRKIEYRQLTGGNFIHASDTPAETNENLLFLLGKTWKEIEREGKNDTVIRHNQDIHGYPCWYDLSTALDTVKKVPFTRIKAYKNSYLIYSRTPNLICRILNASSCFSLSGIHKYSINIGKSVQPIYIHKVN